MGHIERREDSSLIKRIYRGKPGGKSCVGRPRKKWMEDVEEDIKMMGIRCWRRRAQDREEWIPAVREKSARWRSMDSSCSRDERKIEKNGFQLFGRHDPRRGVTPQKESEREREHFSLILQLILGFTVT